MPGPTSTACPSTSRPSSPSGATSPGPAARTFRPPIDLQPGPASATSACLRFKRDPLPGLVARSGCLPALAAGTRLGLLGVRRCSSSLCPAQVESGQRAAPLPAPGYQEVITPCGFLLSLGGGVGVETEWSAHDAGRGLSGCYRRPQDWVARCVQEAAAGESEGEAFMARLDSWPSRAAGGEARRPGRLLALASSRDVGVCGASPASAAAT